MQTRCVHSPLTTCTHDRSKNRGKGVVFITCPRKFNVREIKKKGVLEHSVREIKKIGYFFQNPQQFTPLKIQYFLADFSRFPSVFHQIWLFFVRKIQVRKISTFLWPEIPVWLIINTKCSEKSCPCFCANRGSSGKLSLI